MRGVAGDGQPEPQDLPGLPPLIAEQIPHLRAEQSFAQRAAQGRALGQRLPRSRPAEQLP